MRKLEEGYGKQKTLALGEGFSIIYYLLSTIPTIYY